jgi:hypothetical protein
MKELETEVYIWDLTIEPNINELNHILISQNQLNPKNS